MNDVYVITCARQAVKISQYEEMIDRLQRDKAGMAQMIDALEKEAEARTIGQKQPQEGNDG